MVLSKEPETDAENGASKTAQWVKALATKPDDLSLTIMSHMLKGENQFL